MFIWLYQWNQRHLLQAKFLDLLKYFLVMFPFLFRIGPVFIAEIIFASIGASELIIGELLPCYGYTFVELSLQLFLIETIVVLRLITKNKDLRVKYISNVVFGTKDNYLAKQVWNGLCIGAVIMGLLYWMVKEGLTLTNSAMRDSQKIYTLYPLCFFSNLANHPEPGQQFGMVMNFLYSCNVIINLIIAGIVTRSFYLYSQNIRKNRTFFIKHSIQQKQTLIDCDFINQSLNESLLSKQNSDDIQCGICLRKLYSQKIIKLRCSHFFHDQCINLWLRKKDACPYRCI